MTAPPRSANTNVPVASMSENEPTAAATTAKR